MSHQLGAAALEPEAYARKPTQKEYRKKHMQLLKLYNVPTQPIGLAPISRPQVLYKKVHFTQDMNPDQHESESSDEEKKEEKKYRGPTQPIYVAPTPHAPVRYQDVQYTSDMLPEPSLSQDNEYDFDSESYY